MAFIIIIIIILAVVGGASIAGGFVAYRAALTTSAKVVSAAGMAAGSVMWAVILFIVPISSSTGTDEQIQPQPDAESTAIPKTDSISGSVNDNSNGMTLESFENLLTLEDIKAVSQTEYLDFLIIDYKERAAQVDPSHVVNIHSWYGLIVDAGGGEAGGGGAELTMTVIDFDSLSAAETRYELAAGERLLAMGTAVGDRSAGAELNDNGIGSMLVFMKGEVLVSLHTAQGAGLPPMVTQPGLEELGKLVSDRLGTDN